MSSSWSQYEIYKIYKKLRTTLELNMNSRVWRWAVNDLYMNSKWTVVEVSKITEDHEFGFVTVEHHFPVITYFLDGIYSLALEVFSLARQDLNEMFMNSKWKLEEM